MKKYNKKTVKIKSGETLAYIEAGKGDKTVLLVHGNMSSSIHWTPLIEKLEGKYKIFAVDMRGFGDSTYNKRFNHLNELADDIAEFIKELGLKDLYIAGWSTGGGVCMSLAARYPQFVKKVFLVDSMSCQGFPVFKKDEKGAPIVGQVYATKDELALDPVQVAPAQACIESKNFSYMDYLWNLTIYTGRNKPSFEDNKVYIEETFKQRCLVDVDWSLANFNQSDMPNFYTAGDGLAKTIKVPVFIFWGEKDITISPLMTDQNRRAFATSTFLVVPESGHSPLVDNVEFLAEHFIKEI